MAIRLNLLAEAQAAEELRRRDPVKGALWICGFLVALVLLWSISLQVKIMRANGRLNQLETSLGSQTNQYQQVIRNKNDLVETERKLVSLTQLATNRFLWASTLNALQQTTVNDVQMLRFHAEQSYLLTEEVKASTNEFSKFVPGKPGSVTERIVLTLDAKDTGLNPGSQIERYKATLADFHYFRQALARTNALVLKTVSPPQIDGETGRSFRQFVLECRFPEKVFK